MKSCPYCLAEIASEAKKCKFCGEWVEPNNSPGDVPAEVKLTVQPPSRGPMTTCPYCLAQIPEDAWTCMYCKRGVIGGRPMAIGITVLGVLVFAIFFFGFWLPGFLDAQKRHEEFQREWNRPPKDNDDFKKKFDEHWNQHGGF